MDVEEAVLENKDKLGDIQTLGTGTLPLYIDHRLGRFCRRALFGRKN